MAVTIRLMRIGKKGKPNYRIIAIDKRKKQKGAYLENIGHYDPMVNPPKLQFNREKLNYWLEKGATMSEGVKKLKLNTS